MPFVPNRSFPGDSEERVDIPQRLILRAWVPIQWDGLGGTRVGQRNGQLQNDGNMNLQDINRQNEEKVREQFQNMGLGSSRSFPYV